MLNSCSFIGNLGADPDIKRTQDGKPICNLSVAVTENWKDKNTGERKSKTEWIRVVIFSEGLAKVSENYLKKGSKIFLQGKMQTRKWQDQQGQDRYSTEIVLQGFDAKLIMLDGKSKEEHPSSENTRNSYSEKSQGSSGSSFEEDIEDSIPF